MLIIRVMGRGMSADKRGCESQSTGKASRGRWVRGPQGQEEAQGTDQLCLLCNAL